MHPFMVDGEDPERPGKRKIAVVREKATDCDLCTAVPGAELRLRLPARRRHARRARQFFGIPK